MRSRPNIARYYAVVILLAAVGVICAVYVLAHEGGGLPSPWQSTYTVKAEFTAADGVVAGIGQPVDVAGVGVGSIVGDQLRSSGNALVTMRIQSSQLSHVYRNATATLVPITPLDDMRIELTPGGPPAPALRGGATLPVAQTSSPIQLSDLLRAFNGDTRDAMASLIASLEQGTAGQGANMRSALLALGPTTTQVRLISQALAGRRVALAQLVHNLAQVADAASRDHQLAGVVRAGNETLQAVAAQEGPLRQAVAELPGTLSSVHSTLGYAATFADHLRPAAAALVPALRPLPHTLSTLIPFTRAGASMIGTQLLPFVDRAQPVVRDLGAATPKLTALAPNMTSSLQGINYLLNTVAYNPNNIDNGSLDEGGLFWLSWFIHNWNSGFSLGDANGAMGRATFADSCLSETNMLDAEVTAVIKASIGLSELCPTN